MYGYPVRGPLALVRSTWLQNQHASITSTKQSVLQYLVSISKCCELAIQRAQDTRTAAKTWYVRNARFRHFDEGDLVLVLLPVSGKPLLAKYQGPYRIVRKLGPVDYIVAIYLL